MSCPRPWLGRISFGGFEPEEVLVLDLNGNKLEGNGEISRETPTHMKLLHRFYPGGRAVIHAHPRNTLVFCAAEQPIQPVMEGVLKYGEIKLVEYANGGIRSEDLAENVLKGLIGQENLISGAAALVLSPWHGVFAVGKSLYATLDAIDRIENNAYCILMSKLLLEGRDQLEDHRQALIEAVKATRGESDE